jgi:hypothetical protein
MASLLGVTTEKGAESGHLTVGAAAGVTISSVMMMTAGLGSALTAMRTTGARRHTGGMTGVAAGAEPEGSHTLVTALLAAAAMTMMTDWWSSDIRPPGSHHV